MARKLSGIVTSTAMYKTIIVTVTTRKTHRIYGKSYLVSKKFPAHDALRKARSYALDKPRTKVFLDADD